jgi:hypothetical protein
MKFKKKKVHLKNHRKEVHWGSPKKYQKGGETFETHDLSVANENTNG